MCMAHDCGGAACRIFPTGRARAIPVQARARCCSSSGRGARLIFCPRADAATFGTLGPVGRGGNRPGASTDDRSRSVVAKSPADGYTLLLTAELTLVTVPHLYEKVPYDSVADFAPITALVSATQASVANPSSAGDDRQ